MLNLYGLPTWGRRNPFSELEKMRNEMDALTRHLFRRSGQTRVHSGVFPTINLSENKDSYYIRAELPGMDESDLDIQVSGNTLSISGERKIAAEKNVKYHRREREAGKFSRIVHLPQAADTEKIEASLANGMLSLKVAKAEKAKPRQITVN